MNELDIRWTKFTFYKFVTDSNGKTYVMDTRTISNKLLEFGNLSSSISVDMIEIDPNNTAFEQKATLTKKFVGLTGAVQVFSTLTFRMITNFFETNPLYQQLFMKFFLFACSLFISFLLAKFYFYVYDKQAKENLPEQSKRYRATFKVHSQRRFSGYLFVAIIVALFLVFFNTNNGTEGAILVMNSLLSLVFFIVCLGMCPVELYYRDKIFILESIKEIQ